MGFTWQHGRQMAGAVTEEEAIGYWYNADGIRTKKFRSNGEVTDYYLNGSNIITMITNNIIDPENPSKDCRYLMSCVILLPMKDRASFAG